MKQINCPVDDALYADISMLCAQHGLSRAEFGAAIIAAQATRLEEWIQPAKEFRVMRVRSYQKELERLRQRVVELEAQR